MRHRTAIGLGLAALAALLVAGCAKPQDASTSSAVAAVTQSPAATDTPQMASVQLQNAAAAVGAQGRKDYADVYASLSLDIPGNQLILYVTDTGRGQKLVDAARVVHPDIAGINVRIVAAKYTSRDEVAAMERVSAARAAGTLPKVTGAGVAPDGSGIIVDVSKDTPVTPDLTAAIARVAAPVPVTVDQKDAAVPLVLHS